MKKKKKKHGWIILITIIAVIGLQTLPVLFPRPLFSEKIENENINLYYQKGDEKGAEEVFDLLNERADEIRAIMDIRESGPTDVYIYKTQWQLAIREAGFITIAIAPKWHIGDSHNGNLMMVSPYADVKVHTHESILNATLHEFVHSLVFHMNPDLSYFWDNGLATYLSEQEPEDSELTSRPVPTVSDMQTENGLRFGEMGGYAFSYNYIEYMEKTYGWEKVMDFTSGNKTYGDVFDKTEKEIHADWTRYIQNLTAAR